MCLKNNHSFGALGAIGYFIKSVSHRIIIINIVRLSLPQRPKAHIQKHFPFVLKLNNIDYFSELCVLAPVHLFHLCQYIRLPLSPVPTGSFAMAFFIVGEDLIAGGN